MMVYSGQGMEQSGEQMPPLEIESAHGSAPPILLVSPPGWLPEWCSRQAGLKRFPESVISAG